MVSVELRTRACGGHVGVLRGELDTADAELMGSAVADVADDGQRLIIDLHALDYIDCHALSALLRTRDTARQTDGDMLLVAPRGLVLRLLTLAAVPGVYASVDAAADGGRRARELPVLSVPESRRVPDAS